jgi:anti-sigma factor RsiW
MSESPESEDAMHAIEELLPWYAAGTLDAAATKRVEDALAREPRLRTSLQLVREDRDETITLNEELGAPGPQAWARVLAVAQAEPRKPTLTRRLAAFGARIGALAGFGANPAPGRLAWAGAAALLVIVLQGAAIVSLLPSVRGPTYDTASQRSAAVDGATAVAFAPDASLAQVAELLQKHKASIVDGPRSGGLFTLRVGDKTMTKEQLDAAVAELRGEAIVRMALPGPVK